MQKQFLEVFYEKMFLKISQSLQENTCFAVSFLMQLQAETLPKKKARDCCFQ